MQKKIEIIPAILATTEAEYKNQLDKIEQSGASNGGWIHVDLMDNKFVQNESVGLDVVAKYPTQLLKEAHLMVADPINWIDELIRYGTTRILFHLETENVDQVIEVIKNKKTEVGLAVSPETDLDRIKPYLNKIDLVLIMGVHPGFGGQAFIPETVDKLKKVKECTDGQVLIGVDGGMNEESAKLVVDAGANHIVIGSHILQGDVGQNLKTIWEAIRS